MEYYWVDLFILIRYSRDPEAILNIENTWGVVTLKRIMKDQTYDSLPKN